MESTQQNNPRIQYLTDELINIYSGGNVLTTYKDSNMKVKQFDKVVEGGPLDGIIFGSMFLKQCNCGRVRIPGKFCRNCMSYLYDEEVSVRRYARIDLPFYYLSDLRRDQFNKFVSNNIPLEFKFSEEFRERVGNSIKSSFIFDFCQFNYNDETGGVIVTDQITDPNLCSYEGLLRIVIDYFPSLLQSYKQFINSSILVIPLPFRAPRYEFDGVRKVLKNHEITVAYKLILYAVLEYYPAALDSMQNASETALLRATLKRFVCDCLNQISSLTRPSKENLSRLMQSHRLTNSGRCTIVPAPDLKVDEVYIPRFLMYEACKDEFIQYLMITQGWNQSKAESMYIQDASTKEVQDLFEKYIDEGLNGLGKYVIINRNPTLYELGMTVNKVRLTGNYTIGLPLLLCSPLGGDFDGDTVSFYSIPDDLTNVYIDKMSPRNLIYYKKNQKPLYTPSHEMMAGLLVATKQIQTPDYIENFDSYDDANQKRKTDRNFKWQTVCVIEGKKTTLARYKLGELFGVDMDDFLGYHKVGNLTSDLVTLLYDNLTRFDDRVDRIQQIQEFALMISTTSGATAPKLSELHANLNRVYLDRIKAVENDPNLSDREKDLKVRLIFDEFIDKSVWQYDEKGNKSPALDENGKPIISIEVRRQVSESSRAKDSQLFAMVMPQLNVGTDKMAHVSETSLIEGMSPTDYTRHAAENRVIQDIKQMATPRSGYNTRQLTFLGASYFFSEQTDEGNKGIEIPLKDAAGRTRIDGTVITIDEARRAPKGASVKVRSILTTTLLDRYKVSKDCISNVNKWNEGDNVGISLLTSMTEGLTQSGLSLKHGGRLFETDKKSAIRAPESGTAQILDNFVIFNGDSGTVYKYPKSINFVLNYSPQGKYTKDEVVGVSYKLFTPSYRLDSIISLIGAAKAPGQRSILNNTVLVSECYAFAEGDIHYNLSKGKIVGVSIGDITYGYNEEACYFLPEGTHVRYGERFCTGMLDLDSAIRNLKDYIKVFYLFKKQFDELIPGMMPELIEMVYSIIVRKSEGRITHTNVQSAVRGVGSLYTNMAFRDTKFTLRRINPKGSEFLMDAFSSILLPTFFMLDQ